MAAPVSPAPAPVAAPRGALAARLLVPFAERPRVEQVAGGLVVPVAFGLLCGVVLGWSASASWLLQGLSVAGGLSAGFEHRGAAAGARRGAVGGLLFGAGVLLGHALAGTDAEASLGAVPGLLPVVTGAIGCALGAFAGARRVAFDTR